MHKLKKFKEAIYCVKGIDGKKNCGHLQIPKEWVRSKGNVGYGLKKGTFLSFVNHKWNQAKYRGQNEFFIYSKEFSRLSGVGHRAIIRYAKEFKELGFYSLEKQDQLGDIAINSFIYKPNGSFPKFENAWNVPLPIIRPAELGGFGLTHGMILFYLIDKCLLNESETFRVTMTEIGHSFGMNRKEAAAIMDKLIKTEMIGLDGGKCSVDIKFISVYFSHVNAFWEEVKDAEVTGKGLETLFSEVAAPVLRELILPFK